MAASLLFLLGPALVAFLLRPAAAVDRRPWAESIARLRETKLDLFAVCFALPLLMLLLVALGKTVGLHWLLAFCTCLFPVLVMLFRTGGLLRLVKWTGIYTLTLTGLVIILLLLPRQWASWHKSYDSIALGIWPDKILDQMREAAPGAHLASTSYAKAALLEFYAREHVMVVGPAQFHGRQDDLTTDFRLLDGQSIVIVTSRPRHVERFIPWFDQYRYSTIDVEGASFIVFVGDGFRYAVYRELVLRSVAEDFYALPAWLKRFSGACYFCDKYDLCGDRDN